MRRGQRQLNTKIPSPSGAALYPYFRWTPEMWDVGGGCPRKALMTFHISVMSSSLFLALSSSFPCGVEEAKYKKQIKES